MLAWTWPLTYHIWGSHPFSASNFDQHQDKQLVAFAQSDAVKPLQKTPQHGVSKECQSNLEWWKVCFHCILMHFAFMNTPTFPAQTSVIFCLDILRGFFPPYFQYFHSQIKHAPINLTCMSLDCGRKPEHRHRENNCTQEECLKASRLK